MEQSLDKKASLKENIRIFFFRKKKLIIFIVILITLFLTAAFIWNENQKKENLQISEKYVRAGILLSNDEKEKALKFYEEIILSKNEFYSLLALNTIIEKKLFSNEETILNFFSIIEEQTVEKEYIDLVLFKKALFLIKLKKEETARELLNVLISNNSKLKNVAKELIID